MTSGKPEGPATDAVNRRERRCIKPATDVELANDYNRDGQSAHLVSSVQEVMAHLKG
ncbi:MAG: hypothetical protein KTR25_08700 [Myxococcales bacterium]|nr:hypothetical protein [Myxococcales bacterium]